MTKRRTPNRSRPSGGKRVSRDPSLPQPPVEQVAKAVSFLKSHERAPGWDLTPYLPYLQWCSRQNDPFLKACVGLILAMSPNPDSGLSEPPARLIAHVRELASEAVTRLSAAQEVALQVLKEAVEGVDPVPLLTAMMFVIWAGPWGRYYEPDNVPNALDIEIVGSIVAASAIGDRRSAIVGRQAPLICAG